MTTQHGGRREGSGRKPLPDSRTRCFVLTNRHLKLIRDWMQARGCASASQALRQMIEEASK
jgi:hypothetical protein